MFRQMGAIDWPLGVPFEFPIAVWPPRLVTTDQIRNYGYLQQFDPCGIVKNGAYY